MAIHFPDFEEESAARAGPRRLSRRAILLAATVTLFVLQTWICLQLATATPWLGVRLEPAADGAHISRISAAGPAAGNLTPGTRLRALGNALESGTTLQADDLAEEPDYFAAYADYQDFFGRQDRLWRILSGPGTWVELQDGTRQALRPAANRPVSDLPPLFWLQLLFATVALGAGATAAILRPHAGAYWYFGTSVALALTFSSAAVYSTRELALPGTLFHGLSLLNHFGGLLFTGCALAMIWTYPRPLGRIHMAAVFPGVFLVVWLLQALQWMGSNDTGFRIPVTLGLFGFCGLSAAQWHLTRGHPADRAALKWFLFSWLSGTSLFGLALIVPVVLGSRPLLPQGYLFGLLLACYVCMPLGLTRYRLFELDRWWFNAWSAVAAAIAVLALQTLFQQLFETTPAVGLLAAIAVIGWCFSPLRRAVWTALHRQRHTTRMERFTQASALILQMAPDTVPIRLWKQMLQTAFAADAIQAAGRSVTAPGLAEEGNAIELPALPRTESLVLRGAEHGERLFDREDVKIAQTLAGLFEQAMAARDAHALGAEAERARLRRELHEDLGARLLNQIYSTSNEDEAAASRVLLEEVRALIDLLDHRDFLLDECATEWKVQFEEQCQQAALPFKVQLDRQLPGVRLSAVERSYPVRILREALGNSLRHSQPKQCWLQIGYRDGGIELVFEHDGLSLPATQWRPSRGIRNIDLRVRDLRGHLAWSQPTPDRLRMELHFVAAHGPAS